MRTSNILFYFISYILIFGSVHKVIKLNYNNLSLHSILFKQMKNMFENIIHSEM